MTLPYVLPNFNLSANIWRAGNPLTNPPDVVTDCNLALGRRGARSPGNIATHESDFGTMWLLLPKGTDIRDGKSLGGADVVEVPAGTGRIYNVIWVDDAGLGFSNEHRFAVILAKSPWPVPFPTTTPTPPLVGPTLLFGGSSPAGTTPIPVFFTVPAGPIYMVCLVVDSIGALPVVTVGSQGTVFPFFIRIGTGIAGQIPQLLVYRWLGPGGIDNLMVYTADFPLVGYLMFAEPAGILDIEDGTTLGAAPFDFISPGVTAAANEFCLGTHAICYHTSGGVFVPPFFGGPIADAGGADANGLVWDIQTTYALIPVLHSHIDFAYTGSSTNPVEWLCIISSYQ